MTHDYGTASHWFDVLHDEFEKESDRAAVILVTSLFENALASLLRHHLVPTSSSEDELIDQPNAPLSSFSAKINIVKRLGLISAKYARDLHLIRRIRNEFAHNVQGCTFESTAVRSRILELAKSSGIIERNPKMRSIAPPGPRGDFLSIASWMLFALNLMIEVCPALEEADLEWGYNRDVRVDDEITEEPSDVSRAPGSAASPVPVKDAYDNT